MKYNMTPQLAWLPKAHPTRYMASRIDRIFPPAAGLATIYEIRCGNGVIHYIGHTCSSLYARLVGHKSKRNSTLFEWLNDNSDATISPLIFVLQHEMLYLEHLAIMAGFDAGYPLLNIKHKNSVRE